MAEIYSVQFRPKMTCSPIKRLALWGADFERRLSWGVAGQGDPVHDAAETVVVVDRVVLDTAVVPNGKRPRLPAKAAGEFRPGLVLEQIAQ